jgi:anti-sigma factor RsiW
MICEQWRDNLDAYIDSVQDPSLIKELTGFEEHLHACRSCTGEVLNRLQIKRATRAAAARYAPSTEFRLRIKESIQPKRKRARGSFWIPSLAAVSVLILIAAIAAQVWVRRAERQQAVAQLVDLHVATIASANPVDVVSTDRLTVKPWFQGKLPFTFNLPELANSPYKLLGGKVAYLQNKPGAQLLFELQKHELSVFIAQDQGRFVLPGSGALDLRQNGFSVEGWKQGGLSYTIVSDAGLGDVRGLGDLLKSAARQ